MLSPLLYERAEGQRGEVTPLVCTASKNLNPGILVEKLHPDARCPRRSQCPPQVLAHRKYSVRIYGPRRTRSRPYKAKFESRTQAFQCFPGSPSWVFEQLCREDATQLPLPHLTSRCSPVGEPWRLKAQWSGRPAPCFYVSTRFLPRASPVTLATCQQRLSPPSPSPQWAAARPSVQTQCALCPGCPPMRQISFSPFKLRSAQSSPPSSPGPWIGNTGYYGNGLACGRNSAQQINCWTFGD